MQAKSQTQSFNQSSPKAVLISRDKFDAVLFDMDGVVTKTATVHTTAWKDTFDAFLRARQGPNYQPFTERDYLTYVDGKSREEGIKSFLQSRGISLRIGEPDDKPGLESIYALGNKKNEEFLQLVRTRGVEPYETTVQLIRLLKAQGFKVAIITASKNGAEILKAANLSHVFDTKVDGLDAQRLGLPSKPAPDLFLEAARKLGVPPARAVVVEDAASGVEAGHRGHFGLVIGVARHNNVELLKEHGATVVVHDLAEVGVSGVVYPGIPGTALADLEISDKNWVLRYTDYVPEMEGRREALCAVGNGFFCTRAAAPESHADGTHYPGTYIAGVYNRLKSEIGGTTFEQEELVNMPNWLSVTFRIENDPWFDLRHVELLAYSQRLDLREGVIHRKIVFRDGSGRESILAQRWFVHMHLCHIAGIETTLKAVNWSGRLTVRSAIDGRVRNLGTPRDRHLNNKHLEPVEHSIDGEVLYLKMETNQSQVAVSEAARTQVYLKERELDVERNNIEEDDYVAQDLLIDVTEGESIIVRKVATVYTSRDRGISESGLAARSAVQDAPDFIGLLSSHIQSWRNLWQQFDLFLETNEQTSKMLTSLLVHLHSFHAVQTASPNSIDLDVGVPARGWTGEGYQGHIFWDDLFVFPFINLRMPNITQALLKYRFRRVDQARKIAQSVGAKGARFPWQSGSNGREETPRYLWIPNKEIWIPDRSHLQVHVDAAIAYNIWQYYQVTADLDFIHAYGAEMLIEIARFFATFAKYNEARDRYEIHGVLGPDEFHTAYPNTDQPGINNNAYTNVMAVWTLCRALELLKVMPADHREQVSEHLGLTHDEIAHWDEVSRKMYVPLGDDGIINQFEGYEKLEEFPFKSGGKLDMQKLRLLLDKENGAVNQYKVSKQADVLMLFYVFSTEELAELFQRLGYRFDPKMIRINAEYYIPRTANTSTLSRVAHAWVLSRLDRMRSWRLLSKMCPDCPRDTPGGEAIPHSWDIFLEALGSDFFDIQGGSTRQGIHMGAMAGSIDIVQRCYTGIVTRGDVLWLNPQLPDELTRLSFSLHYRDQALAIDITQDALYITARHSSAKPIKIGFAERVYQLNAGESLRFGLKKKHQHRHAA